jgi:hypothetical protein
MSIVFRVNYFTHNLKTVDNTIYLFLSIDLLLMNFDEKS